MSVDITDEMLTNAGFTIYPPYAPNVTLYRLTCPDGSIVESPIMANLKAVARYRARKAMLK